MAESRIAASIALAGGFSLSALWLSGQFSITELFVALSWLPASGFRDCGNHVSRYAYSASAVVSSNVVGDYAEERGQRTGFAAFSRPEQVRDRVDDAAPVAPCNGEAGARFAHWTRRSG